MDNQNQINQDLNSNSGINFNLATVAPSSTSPVPVNQNKKSFPWLFFLGGVIVLGLIVFLTFKFYFVPLQIKEKAVYLKEIFSDYKKTVEKIIDYMTEDSFSTFSSESIKRQAEKGRLLMKDYQEIYSKLKRQIERTNLPEINAWVKEIENYINQSEKIYQLTEDSISWAEKLYPNYKKYEDLSVEIQGVSNYLYYDPEKYTNTLEEFLEKDKTIIDSVKKIDVEKFKEINDLMVEKFEIEYQFLENVVEAVKNRAIDKIADSEKEYSKNALEIDKKLGAEIEKINDQIKDLSREIKAMGQKVDEEYNQLRGAYRF